MQSAARLMRWLNWLESVAAALAYTIVAGLLIADVLGREVFGHGVFGAQKMAVYAAVVAGFLGLSLTTAANAHLRPSFMDTVLTGPGVARFGDGFACAFYLFMAGVAVIFIQQSMEFQDRAAVLYWLLWPIQIVIPYAFASTAFRHAVFALFPDLKPQERATT